MKKILILGMFSLILFTSCKNEELEKSEKKGEELKCKAEFIQSLIGNSENIIVLGNQSGLKNEYEEYLKIQSDSTKTCEEIKKAWEDYTNLVDKKTSK
jgi:hypothetical protein